MTNSQINSISRAYAQRFKIGIIKNKHLDLICNLKFNFEFI